MKNYNPVGKTTKTEWLTPIEIIKSLGEFDLDPCTPLNRPWDTAKNHYTIEDDGLKQDWFGRVWLNPPYSNKQITPFIQKMSKHRNGILLVFGRTDVNYWHKYIFPYADAFLFIKGRLKFYHASGEQGKSATASSVLIAYGQENVIALENSKITGKILYNTKEIIDE